jgi:hypothetical protein
VVRHHQRRPTLSWRAAETRTRLLPGSSVLMPETWRRWEEPGPPLLPIDTQISRLAERKRRPRLDSRERLEWSGIACPYWYAREATYAAAEAAMLATAQQQTASDRDTRPARLALGTSKAQRVAAELQRLWSETEPSAASRRIADLLSEIEHELADIKAYVIHRYSSREASVGELWKTTFVRHLARAWEDLTGSPPRGGKEFPGFVAAAWHSLADAIPGTSWEQAVHAVVGAKRQARRSAD